jgi:hypothetical protein
MSDIQVLARARQSFEEKAWSDSCRLFQAADREAQLEPEDLERLATAAYLMGRAPWLPHQAGSREPSTSWMRRAWSASCAVTC